MNRARMQRRKARKAWARAVLVGLAAVVMLVAATTIVCARVEALTNMEREISEEYRWYLDSQKPAAPQTWDELAAAIEESGEIEENAEAPFESECIEEALLKKATKIEGATVSHYCICKKCCGKDESHPAYGITKSGRRAVPGTSVAVDPSVIPLGADVLVDYGDGEIHYYRADDTGSAVKGNHIDLCVEDHETAWELGKRTATVWWVYGEED